MDILDIAIAAISHMNQYFDHIRRWVLSNDTNF